MSKKKQKNYDLLELNRTRIYEEYQPDQTPVVQAQPDAVPKYKYYISKYYTQHIENCEAKGLKPLSIRQMKLKYGLPNNSDDYFNIMPGHPNRSIPTTMQERHAFILVILLQMHPDDASCFMESLKYPRLDSPNNSLLARDVLYVVKQEFEANYALQWLQNRGHDFIGSTD